MKPTHFKEANVNLSKPNTMTDDECGSLHIHTDGQTCISLWELSWKERFRILLFGKIWVGVMSGSSQPPIWIDCTKTVFEDENN